MRLFAFFSVLFVYLVHLFVFFVLDVVRVICEFVRVLFTVVCCSCTLFDSVLSSCRLHFTLIVPCFSFHVMFIFPFASTFVLRVFRIDVCVDFGIVVPTPYLQLLAVEHKTLYTNP